MITLFTTAKPFEGRWKINQVNAIRSWQEAMPDCEIILFGQGAGYEEIAKRLKLIWVPEVETSPQGTPLVGSMFSIADRLGKFPLKAYINCDILLLSNLVELCSSLPFPRFLMVGQRRDIWLDEPLDFASATWKSKLLEKVSAQGALMDPCGVDYFLYKGEVWNDLPSLVIGRAAYDNYLLYHCLKEGIPLIDATVAIMAVHQNHDYSHQHGGKNEIWAGAEASQNKGNLPDGFAVTIADSNFAVTKDGLQRNYCRGDRLRFWEVRSLVQHHRLGKLYYALAAKLARYVQAFRKKLKKTR